MGKYENIYLDLLFPCQTYLLRTHDAESIGPDIMEIQKVEIMVHLHPPCPKSHSDSVANLVLNLDLYNFRAQTYI